MMVNRHPVLEALRVHDHVVEALGRRRQLARCARPSPRSQRLVRLPFAQGARRPRARRTRARCRTGATPRRRRAGGCRTRGSPSADVRARPAGRSRRRPPRWRAASGSSPSPSGMRPTPISSAISLDHRPVADHVGPGHVERAPGGPRHGGRPRRGTRSRRARRSAGSGSRASPASGAPAGARPGAPARGTKTTRRRSLSRRAGRWSAGTASSRISLHLRARAQVGRGGVAGGLDAAEVDDPLARPRAPRPRRSASAARRSRSAKSVVRRRSPPWSGRGSRRCGSRPERAARPSPPRRSPPHGLDARERLNALGSAGQARAPACPRPRGGGPGGRPCSRSLRSPVPSTHPADRILAPGKTR